MASTKTAALGTPKASLKPKPEPKGGTPTPAQVCKRVTKGEGHPDLQPALPSALRTAQRKAHCNVTTPIPDTQASGAAQPRRKQRQAGALPQAGRTASASPVGPARQASPTASAGLADSIARPQGAGRGKQAQVLSMLGRPQGATIPELMQATGWMSHSVRGLLSAVVKRKLGLALASTVAPERGRVYRIPARASLAGLESGAPAAPTGRRGRATKQSAGTPADAVG